jgi:uncharacterized protein
MLRFPFPHAAALPVFGILILSSACASPPSRLYLLSPLPSSGQHQATTPSSAGAEHSGSSLPTASTPTSREPLVAVAVSIPEYLDRPDIVERTSANEVKPDYSAQWGENLATTATRALAGNLEEMVPSDDVSMLPSSRGGSFDYLVNLNLTRFESDEHGVSTLAGRWSIADRNGVERAAGRVQRSENATGPGYDAMAAAMSRNLAAVSVEIAQALQRLPPPSESSTERASSPAATARR